MVIEEWGVTEPDACCGKAPETKAEWFYDSMGTIKSWPEVKAVIYTNVVADYRGHVVDFTIDSPAAAEAAYIDVGHDPYFNSG